MSNATTTITYKTGNIFKSNCNVLVNPVNCKGVMGAGLAKQFKIKFPEMFKYYKDRCGVELSEAGKSILYQQNLEFFSYGNDVLCIATKNDWREQSTLQIIERCCIEIVSNINTYDIQSIAIPKLGCGLGGLKWEDVKPIMEKHFSDLKCKIEIYI